MILLRMILAAAAGAPSPCAFDVVGSYGDARQTGTGVYAGLLGLACSGKCYQEAARWSDMALRHGDQPVDSADACRALCAESSGCQVWTWSRAAGTCRAMRSLLPRRVPSPTLYRGADDAKPETLVVTGGVSCGTQSFLAWPDGLVPVQVC